ncbi:MAG: polysaccharide biosynthesis C-terminal domain-containing protein [Anaerohalosphaeraceae bacterium]
MHRPSLKINFLWAFAGNSFYALCGYLLLTILAKTSPVETVGLWGIGQAVTLPVATFFSLKLCTVNITDIRNAYQTGDYIAVRLLASLASVVISAVIGFVFYPLQTALVISFMGISQAIAEIRAYFLSNFQKYERLNLATGSQVAEGVLALLLFLLLYWPTRNLLLAIGGIILARLSVLCFYDMPVSARVLSAHQPEGFGGYRPRWHWPKIWSLFKYASPLAVVGAVMNISQHVPRLVMDKTLGRDAVGYFTALSMLLVVYTMIHSALGNAALPRLSIYFKESIRSFVRLFVQLIVLMLAVGLVFVAGVYFVGKPLLTFLFTAEYARYNDVLVMLAVASSVLAVFSVSNWGLNATRQFVVQMPIYIGTAVVSGVCSVLLIPRFGIMGGAYAFFCSYMFGALICIVFVMKAIRKNHVG